MKMESGAQDTGREPALLRWALNLFPLVAFAAFLLIQHKPLFIDEPQHYGQIERFIARDWSMDPLLTTVPGYHALIAGLAMATGWTSLAAARFFSLLLSLCAVGVFYLLARECCRRFASARSLQFAFMPILFPFLPLVYTDVPSLLFILLMTYFTLRGRSHMGGLMGLVSCLIRQSNIVWVVFVMLLSYVSEHGWAWPRWRDWPGLLARHGLFLLTGALFAAFLAINGGVSIGDSESHPFSRIHLTNVFFLLFLACFMFLPAWFVRRREIGALLRRRETWPGLAALFFAFWFGFVNDHYYNMDPYFLRNILLMFFTSSALLKLLFFIPVALTVLWLWAVPLRDNWWLLYPFTVLSLLPVWLVEQRYYLIPLSLFLLARKPESKAVEYTQLGLFAVMAAAIFVVIERGWRFL